VALVLRLFALAKEVTSKNDCQDYKCTDVKAEQTTIEKNKQQDDYPQNVAALKLRHRFAVAASTSATSENSV